MSNSNSIVKLTALFGLSAGLLTACGASPAEQASTTKIVGGTIAKDRPFMAGLVERHTDVAFCGGTFISDTVVLTAAHCVADGWTGMRVAGGHRMNKGLTDDKTVAASDVIVHEHYDAEKNDNDIALVFLKANDIGTFGGRVKTAHPNEDATLPEAAKAAIVSGWGSLSSGGEYPDEIREVSVPIIPVAKCKTAGAHYENVTERQVCAGDWAKGGLDSCQGDSGGPLFVEQGASTEVVGVVSWGIGCADKKKPGVYTRVAAFKEWIQSKIDDHQR